MKLTHYMIPGIVVLLLSTGRLSSQETTGIDPEAIIEQALAAQERQREQIQNLVLDAELLEGKYDDKKGFEEENRFVKKVYLKYLPDTVLYYEEYLKYYEKGELQPPEKRDKKAKERMEKARQRKAKNISFSMLKPFYPENRNEYDITYEGVFDEQIEGYVCHHFSVRSRIEDDEHIDGEYFFEAKMFHLVRVDFSPAKLVKKTMFKLNELDMSITYGETADGNWVPREFNVIGKGRAAFLFGVDFAATEYYRNPEINTDIADEIFGVNHDE